MCEGLLLRTSTPTTLTHNPQQSVDRLQTQDRVSLSGQLLAAAWQALTLVSVEAVLDGKVTLPCDIEPSDKTSDRVNMVLWFRDASGKPIYT
ncbi:hypothetical protein FOCC_FOCC003560 [Frankliniella occidentalis]|nr:hypothetical protein FOCC_FOCC003560 [Frankliniella occidentalis]